MNHHNGINTCHTSHSRRNTVKVRMTQFLSIIHHYILDKRRKKVFQQVIGTCLYYVRAVDCTILRAISSIASTQAKATEETEQRVKQLLDYLFTLPNAKVRFYVSKMILNVHSDASHLSEPGSKSRAVGVYFMGDVP